MFNIESNLKKTLKKAVEFHGHLGPFLVIGIRIGLIGMRELRIEKNDPNLRVIVNLKPEVPYSCTLDGLQVVTPCTIGNGRLTFKRSSREISAKLKLSCTQQVVIKLRLNKLQELKNLLQQSISNQEINKCAKWIASLPEKELFIIQK